MFDGGIMLPMTMAAGAQPLWGSWASLEPAIRTAGHLLLFLDYDGTLTPIADHPAKARLPAETKQLLRQLCRRKDVWVVLISGRSVKDLRAMVGLKGLCYVGNHGLELTNPSFRYTNPAARSARPFLKEIAKRLKRLFKKIPGAWLEDKRLSLSLHYRTVAPDQVLLVRNGFYEAVSPFVERKQVHVTTGKEVFEVRPPVHWSKGTIVHWLLARCQAGQPEASIFSIYVGDDETDEDAFQALKTHAVTVAVGPATPLTSARYLVGSPEDVSQLLKRILSLRARRGS